MDSKIAPPVERTSLEHQSKGSELELVQAGSEYQVIDHIYRVTDHIAPVEDEPTLLSDGGSGLKLAAIKLRWHQVFDRKHIIATIATHLGGLGKQAGILERHILHPGCTISHQRQPPS